VAEGLVDPEHVFGTINCNGINARGDICGVTTTSGLAWKIPGRVGDSPILGAGLYVDGAVGAAGSTGRGEANLYNLTSYLIVENLRRGMSPKDAGMEGLRRIVSNTVEHRLLNGRGQPNFGIQFYVLNARGEHAGVTLYPSSRGYAVCDENGPREVPMRRCCRGPRTDSRAAVPLTTQMRLWAGRRRNREYGRCDLVLRPRARDSRTMTFQSRPGFAGRLSFILLHGAMLSASRMERRGGSAAAVHPTESREQDTAGR